MTRSYAALLAPLGLTYPQYLALLTLFESDGRSVGEIGGRLGLDSGTLTPLLKRLERGGYVERRRGEADEREVRVRLTRTGRALEGKLLSVQHDFFCSTALTLEQLTALRCELLALGENLRDGERRGPRRTTSIHRKKRRGVGTPG
jgi:DNA-binding MarR family transcriptional regulator